MPVNFIIHALPFLIYIRILPYTPNSFTMSWWWNSWFVFLGISFANVFFPVCQSGSRTRNLWVFEGTSYFSKKARGPPYFEGTQLFMPNYEGTQGLKIRIICLISFPIFQWSHLFPLNILTVLEFVCTFCFDSNRKYLSYIYITFQMRTGNSMCFLLSYDGSKWLTMD